MQLEEERRKPREPIPQVPIDEFARLHLQEHAIKRNITLLPSRLPLTEEEEEEIRQASLLEGQSMAGEAEMRRREKDDKYLDSDEKLAKDRENDEFLDEVYTNYRAH